MVGRLDLLGDCPGCGLAVFESSNYTYIDEEDEFWHSMCLKKKQPDFSNNNEHTGQA